VEPRAPRGAVRWLPRPKEAPERRDERPVGRAALEARRAGPLDRRELGRREKALRHQHARPLAESAQRAARASSAVIIQGDPARPLARRPHEEGATADHRVERRAADARRTHAARAVALCPENLDAAVAPQPDALRRRHGGVQLLPPRGRVEEHARARTGVAAIRQDVQRVRANRAPQQVVGHGSRVCPPPAGRTRPRSRPGRVTAWQPHAWLVASRCGACGSASHAPPGTPFALAITLVSYDDDRLDARPPHRVTPSAAFVRPSALLARAVDAETGRRSLPRVPLQGRHPRSTT